MHGSLYNLYGCIWVLCWLVCVVLTDVARCVQTPSGPPGKARPRQQRGLPVTLSGLLDCPAERL